MPISVMLVNCKAGLSDNLVQWVDVFPYHVFLPIVFFVATHHVVTLSVVGINRPIFEQGMLNYEVFLLLHHLKILVGKLPILFRTLRGQNVPDERLGELTKIWKLLIRICR